MTERRSDDNMEVRINREIREYTESMFFGLSLRQFICSVIACAVAVLIYFLLRPFMGLETVSWICILGAFPFALLGFIRYNGMSAEKLVSSYIRSEFIIPQKLKFGNENIYYLLHKEFEKKGKKIRKRREYK